MKRQCDRSLGELWVGDKEGGIRVWQIGTEESGLYGQVPLREQVSTTANSDACPPAQDLGKALCLHSGARGHAGALAGLAASGGPQGVVWSGSRDCTRVWHAYRQTSLLTVARCEDLRCCAADGDTVWTGHADGGVSKWGARDAELLLHIGPLPTPGGGVCPGLGRTVASCHRAPSLCQIH
jgi:hypothetical protein